MQQCKLCNPRSRAQSIRMRSTRWLKHGPTPTRRPNCQPCLAAKFPFGPLNSITDIVADPHVLPREVCWRRCPTLIAKRPRGPWPQTLCGFQPPNHRRWNHRHGLASTTQQYLKPRSWKKRCANQLDLTQLCAAPLGNLPPGLPSSPPARPMEHPAALPQILLPLFRSIRRCCSSALQSRP